MGEGGASPGVLPLDDLAAAIERFTGSPRVDRTPDALADELTQLRHLIDHLEVRFSQTAAEFAQTNAWEDWGSVSPIQWIRYECKMGGGAAADRVCVGEQLARLPLSSQALADGQIGFAHMAVLARTAEALTSSDTAKGFDEQLVLNEAKTLSVGRLWRFCHHVRHAADPKGFAADEADAVERRRLQLSPCEEKMTAAANADSPTRWLSSRHTLSTPGWCRSGPASDRTFRSPPRWRRCADWPGRRPVSWSSRCRSRPRRSSAWLVTAPSPGWCLDRSQS